MAKSSADRHRRVKSVVPASRVNALQALCGLPRRRCVAALQQHDRHVFKTLIALVDDGVVRPTDLDPLRVPSEIVARAGRVRRIPVAKKATRRTGVMQNGVPGDRPVAGVASESVARKKSVVVTLPPLPPLTLRLNEWVGVDSLKSWAGFGEKRGSKGRVGIRISCAAKDNADADPIPPAREMVAAYAHLKSHQAEVRDAVLVAFQRHINDVLIGQYGRDESRVADVGRLRRMLEIGSIHPMAVAKKGLAYIGLFFQCTWDPEHAAGALIHGSRVITVGDNEAVGDELAATADGGKRLRLWKR